MVDSMPPRPPADAETVRYCMTDTTTPPDSEALYEAHPQMFADEPFWFVIAVLLVPVGIGIIWLVYWYIRNRCTHITVTDQRVTLARGILAKERIEVELSRVRTVRIDQTFVDRIFNVGILKVYTAGDRPEILQKGLPDPASLRTALRA